MNIRPMIEFPTKEQMPDGQPSFKLMSIVALARTNWRMAVGNTDWPKPLRTAFADIHDSIVERVEEDLATVPLGGRPNWATTANELAQEMTTRALEVTRRINGDVNLSAMAYIQAQITLAAIGGALIDWAR